jgi:hypothetical protein
MTPPSDKREGEMADDRRTRPRDIPLACKLRLCRPTGVQCDICLRLVFIPLFAELPRKGL